jgi:hypothetical protein
MYIRLGLSNGNGERKVAKIPPATPNPGNRIYAVTSSKYSLFGKISVNTSEVTTTINATVAQKHKVLILRKNLCIPHKTQTKTNEASKPAHVYSIFIFTCR